MAAATSFGGTYGRSNPFDWDSLYMDVTTIPNTGYGYFQLVMYLLLYFALLWVGSYFIVVGSELLIFIPGASSVVGSIVLPVFGQLPIILLSIFAGFGAEAQSELEVGVGGLAGGIISQISIYTYLTILLAAVNIDDKTGKADFSKQSKATPTTTYYDYYFRTGVNVGKYTHNNSIYLVITALPFAILLVPNILYVHDSVSDLTEQEKPYDIFAFIFAYLLFAIFVVNQYLIMSANEDTPYVDIRDQFMVKSLRQRLLSLINILGSEVKAAAKEEADNERSAEQDAMNESLISRAPSEDTNSDEVSPLVASEPRKISKKHRDRLRTHIQRIIGPFLDKSALISRTIRMSEVLRLLHDLGVSSMTLTQINTESGSNIGSLTEFASQTLTIDELLDGLTRFLTHYDEYFTSRTGTGSFDGSSSTYSSDSPLEELGEFPSDLTHMSNDDQLHYLRVRASLFLVGGLLLTIYAVDPIILAIDELSTRIGVSSFYAAFLYGGIDISTMLAIFRYGSKRTDRNVFICQDTFLGSAIILNTVGLGTFMAIVYSRGLAWEYLAEATAVLFGLSAGFIFFFFWTVQTMFEGLVMLSIFPLALAIVGIMRGEGYT